MERIMWKTTQRLVGRVLVALIVVTAGAQTVRAADPYLSCAKARTKVILKAYKRVATCWQKESADASFDYVACEDAAMTKCQIAFLKAVAKYGSGPCLGEEDAGVACGDAVVEGVDVGSRFY